MQERTGTSRSNAAGRTISIFTAVGIAFMLGSAALDCRLIWEMTTLTWREGPQMVGFSLAHGPFALLLGCPFALIVWVCVSVGIVLVRRIKKYEVSKQSWITLTVAVFILGALAIPQSLWNGLFVSKLVRSPRAATLFVDAAASGENRTVRGVLEGGISINSTNREGNTALHMAAAAGRLDMISYLIDKGAAINAVDLYGDSPLERASANNQKAAVNMLSARGAKEFKGTPEQRRRVIEEIVRSDIDQMNSSNR